MIRARLEGVDDNGVITHTIGEVLLRFEDSPSEVCHAMASGDSDNGYEVDCLELDIEYARGPWHALAEICDAMSNVAERDDD
jgi:hypothetical protein